MLVRATVIQGHCAGAWSTWVVLEDEDLKQIEFECGRQVLAFLENVRILPDDREFLLKVQTTQRPANDGDASTTHGS